MREIEQDLQEGADIIMVKPALAYLDLIRQARDRFDVPIAAYQVSGEYAMIVAAARNGWIDQERAMLETLTSITRAGASIILTSFEKAAARVLGGGGGGDCSGTGDSTGECSGTWHRCVPCVWWWPGNRGSNQYLHGSVQSARPERASSNCRGRTHATGGLRPLTTDNMVVRCSN